MRHKLTAGLFAIFMLGTLASHCRAQEPKQIQITAKRYSYEPSEITLKKGETVVLIFTASDTTHGIEIKELGIKAELHKGKPVKLTVTPEQTGRFVGKCSHFCGRGHGSMRLTVNVTE